MSTDLSSRLDTLTAKTNNLEGRLSAVETKLAQPDPAVEGLRAELEGVKASMTQAHDEVLLGVDRLDQRENETCLMLFGLPEEQAAGGAQLSQAVGAELHGAAASRGFTASCIISARLGSVSEDTARPHAVLVRCQSQLPKVNRSLVTRVHQHTGSLASPPWMMYRQHELAKTMKDL